MKNETTIECPKHLLKAKTSTIFSIHKKGSEYFAFLNNLDGGRNILIDEKIFNEIKNHWDNEQSINLVASSGTIRNKDNVILPINITSEIDYDE